MSHHKSRITSHASRITHHASRLDKLRLRFPLGESGLVLGASWLLVVPLALWAVVGIYVPILGPALNTGEAWGVAVVTLLVSGVCLLAHALGQAGVTRAVGAALPDRIPLYPLGDAAQVWPAAVTPGREATVALAGPVISVSLAALAALVWEAQLHPYLNLGAFFLMYFNAGLAAINLTPAFPFDGGRLVRAIVWELLEQPAAGTRLGIGMGVGVMAGLAAWGVYLIAQGVRFSLETGSATLGLVGLVLLALAMPRAWRWERLQPDRTSPVPGRWWRIPLAGVLLVGMLGVTVGVLPTNDGLRLPGEAIAVEPMIRVPAEVRQTPGGNFFLTTVIPQTPILVVQRVYGELSPVVEIVPPAQIVPPDITPQEMARISSRMLVESETIAILVGLRLAGYEADLVPLGVMVESVLPESPSQGRLEPGDVVTAINGQPVESAEALVERIQAQDPEATVVLAVERDGQPLEVRVPLMPPEEPDGAPKVGITIGPADFDLDLPFEVEIVPQRVTGGPSAGLMFTLTLYNLVTPEDLTGGYKIAGTGTIAMDGRIGPIGGVEQKVAAAERAGAVYFLSPPENYTDARAVARRIEVVEVATAQEAITFLEGLRPVE